MVRFTLDESLSEESLLLPGTLERLVESNRRRLSVVMRNFWASESALSSSSELQEFTVDERDDGLEARR